MKTYEWTPALIENIDSFDIEHESIIKHFLMVPLRLLKKIKLSFVACAVIYIIVSIFIAYVLWKAADLGSVGYVLIITSSLFVIYFSENKKVLNKIRIRGGLSIQYHKICEANNVDRRFTKDMDKFGFGPQFMFGEIITLFSLKALLYTAFSFVIIFEQFSNYSIIPNISISQYVSGLKFVVLSIIAIDRAVVAVKKDIEGETGMLSPLYKLLQYRESFRRQPFLNTVFYDVDHYIREYTHGTFMIADIDEKSLAYENGLRCYDAISVIGKKKIDGMKDHGAVILKEAVDLWREGETLLLEIYTSESLYTEKKTIEIVGAYLDKNN